jgi:hypothetical protein
MNDIANIKRIQKKCCEHYKAPFTPISAEQLVVISDGVYEREIPIEGVRYDSPSHMSGWWLTTDRYNGDTDSLNTVHYRHILEARPEIATYMALPFGYRFKLGGNDEHVWFDETIGNNR